MGLRHPEAGIGAPRSSSIHWPSVPKACPSQGSAEGLQHHSLPCATSHQGEDGWKEIHLQPSMCTSKGLPGLEHGKAGRAVSDTTDTQVICYLTITRPHKRLVASHSSKRLLRAQHRGWSEPRDPHLSKDNILSSLPKKQRTLSLLAACLHLLLSLSQLFPRANERGKTLQSTINQWLPQSLITTAPVLPPRVEPSEDEISLGGVPSSAGSLGHSSPGLPQQGLQDDSGTQITPSTDTQCQSSITTLQAGEPLLMAAANRAQVLHKELRSSLLMLCLLVSRGREQPQRWVSRC